MFRILKWKGDCIRFEKFRPEGGSELWWEGQAKPISITLSPASHLSPLFGACKKICAYEFWYFSLKFCCCACCFDLSQRLFMTNMRGENGDIQPEKYWILLRPPLRFSKIKVYILGQVSILIRTGVSGGRIERIWILTAHCLDLAAVT